MEKDKDAIFILASFNFNLTYKKNTHIISLKKRGIIMRLSRLNIKKINLNDIDKNYSGQDILMKLGELYQYESGIYGYGTSYN